ncbi:MAG: putative lipid II flippase FtsW [Kiritimatiellae bacterium]|nr:putative lipid II flippase FtsW [Kiritimatiellia bacterium]
MRRAVNAVLVLLVISLAAAGLMVLASASAAYAEHRFRDPAYLIQRQIMWAAVAAVVGLIASVVDYHRWRPWAVPLLVVSAVLLILCFVPGVGVRRNGASRWISLGFGLFQPSELTKFVMVLFLSWWIHRNERRVAGLQDGIVIPMAVMGTVLGLVLIEPDFGTTMLVFLIGVLLLYLGGAHVGYLAVLGALVSGGFAVLVFSDQERMERMLAYLHPERHVEGAAHQLVEAMRAFSLGGVAGVGLDNSVQKHFWLPESHTDFIFPIIGEELGLWATLAFLAAYLGILLCGTWIGWRAPDTFGRLLAWGITLTIVAQALLNIGVVTGCLPTKGIALPLVSYGGSSLAVTGLMIGVLLNVGRHAGGLVSDPDTQRIKDGLRHV